MYSNYDHGIPLEQMNEYGNAAANGRMDIELDMDERPYHNSDLDIQDHGYGDATDAVYELPSRKISTLGYKPIGSRGLRQRKTTAHSKAKNRRPTHIYNCWRNNPQQLNDQIIERWRTEDEEIPEVDEEVRRARRIEELREMTINLSRKKLLRDELRRGTLRHGSGRNIEISCWQSFKYSWAMRREHAKSSIAAAFRTMGLWEGHLKAFASHFGTDVTAYFLFLRWLFVANVLIGLIVLVFLFVPQLLYKFLGKIGKDKFIAELQKPQKPQQNTSLSWYAPMEGGREIITGKGENSSGFFTDTGMYYGDYTDLLILSKSTVGDSYYYDMKMAYLLSLSAYFLIFFLVIAISVAKSYRTNFIESSDKFTFQYVLKVVDGWDYMIDSTKTAQSKQKNIYRDFREFCAGKDQREVTVSCGDQFIMFIYRTGAVCIMLMFVIGCGIAVFFIKVALSEKNIWFKDLLLPSVITAINIFMPFIFSLISRALKFTNPKSIVYTTLVMTMLLYGATLGVYFVTALLPCRVDANDDKKSECEQCWETRLGEKAYSLVVIDFVFGVVVTLISEVIYRLIAQYCCARVEERNKLEGNSILPQFDIARNTMAIIYNQFLLWLGIYYSPLLTVVVVIKLWLIFYIKRITVMNACIPTTRPWRAAKMHTIFLVLLFIGFVVCAIMFGLALTQIEPSDFCGPFTNENIVTEVVTNTLDASKTSENRRYIMDIILSPGVVFGIIVILCVVVHYVRITSTGRKTLISLLKIQITLESKDKAYLRHMLEQVQKHKAHTHEPKTCECPGACNCEEEQNLMDGGDRMTSLRPHQGRRVFARERSKASTIASVDSNISHREDLSKSKISTGDRNTIGSGQ